MSPNTQCMPTSNLERRSQALLFVGSKTKEIRLIESTPEQFDIKYAALSYCWGGVDFLKTTMSTFASRKQHISWEQLSVVVQDAITFSYRLDIQYIWVDSLCIIQDNELDWQVESSNMANIYENAYITIGAVSSPNANVSFLNAKRVRSPSEVFESQIPLRGSGSRLLRSRPRSSQYLSNLCHGPLSTRGWACQEAILSRRIIQFTSTEAKWQCNSESLCECSTYSAFGKLSVRTWAPSAAYETWHQIVHDYSQRQLTIDADKLPAISGIAAKIQQNVSSVYLAGLWKDNLVSDLCWSCPINTPPGHPIVCLSSETGKLKMSPSWSWASINEAVSYLDPPPKVKATSFVSLVACKCDLATLNPYGEVYGSILTMRVPCFQAILEVADPFRKNTYQLKYLNESWKFWPDCLLQAKKPSQKSHNGVDMVDRHWMLRASQNTSQISSPPVKDPEPFTAAVLCLLIRCYRYKGFSKTNYNILVVGKSLLKPGCYERLGYCTAYTDSKVWLQTTKPEAVTLV
ncbi:hypothetical protein G7Y89_g13026 [Cudoniella acicularis]|uniref:Heterokaryon incompatibility domain-containing protein n=1 Tax=Cudoniella acicularis TaxID=354080 RepID=A0A8H4RA32_9HELO|nr:hypothetical protein G7Y89_g13026 [Cudoniella acicularis]